METILCDECGIPRLRFTGIFNDYDARTWVRIIVPVPDDWTMWDDLQAKWMGVQLPNTYEPVFKQAYRYWCPECKDKAPAYAQRC